MCPLIKGSTAVTFSVCPSVTLVYPVDSFCLSFCLIVSVCQSVSLPFNQSISFRQSVCLSLPVYQPVHLSNKHERSHELSKQYGGKISHFAIYSESYSFVETSTSFNNSTLDINSAFCVACMFRSTYAFNFLVVYLSSHFIMLPC